jgi:tRNA-Thr(GGU) m(6)t(6)A37 methyltransferase TsaA
MNKHTPKDSEVSYQINPVGFISRKQDQIFIELLPDFKPALKELETFSHVQVLWWFDQFDDKESRKTTQFDKMPFEAPPLGVFACRSPMRPNPIGLSTATIIDVDHEKGLIKIAGMDAYDGTPVLDLKAYMPSCDRVKNVKVPEWMAQWPEWLPENGLQLED